METVNGFMLTTSSHSRMCHKYDIDYYVKTYDEKLFDDLASEFKVQLA